MKVVWSRPDARINKYSVVYRELDKIAFPLKQSQANRPEMKRNWKAVEVVAVELYHERWKKKWGPRWGNWSHTQQPGTRRPEARKSVEKKQTTLKQEESRKKEELSNGFFTCYTCHDSRMRMVSSCWQSFIKISALLVKILNAPDDHTNTL